MKAKMVVLLIVLVLIGCMVGGVIFERYKRSESVVSGNVSFTLQVRGLERRYLAHAPMGYDGARPVPLVIMLHGAGGTGRGAMEETGWAEKADEEGFITAFPDAVPPDPTKPAQFLTNPQVWNDGSGRGHAGRRDLDDVGFIDRLIDDLCGRFRIDARRIFVTGFSNGASMTFRVGAELSHRVAAIAPVSGHFWLNTTELSRPVPLIFISGTEDPLNPLEGGEVSLPWGGTEEKPPIRESILKWVKLLDCPPEPNTLYDKNGVKAISYGPGKKGSEVVFYTVEGAGHTWPGGKGLLPERIVGKATDKIKATDVIWEFFKSHAMK